MKSITKLCASALFMLSFLLCAADGQSQNSVITHQPKKDRIASLWIGGHAGMVSGAGFSVMYRRNRFAIQAASTPLYLAGNFYISTGLTPHFTFKQGEVYAITAYVSSSVGTFFNQRTNVNAGLGIGAHLIAGDIAIFQLLAGYGGLLLNDPDFFLVPTIGCGMYFNLF